MATHVCPLHDLFDHDRESEDCPCNPRVEYVHPETGVEYSEPLIIHKQFLAPRGFLVTKESRR